MHNMNVPIKKKKSTNGTLTRDIDEREGEDNDDEVEKRKKHRGEKV